MTEIFCNIYEPDLYKIANVTKNKLSGLVTKESKLYIKLNGSLMLVTEARKQMLDGIELVTFNNNPCKV